jgi:DNA-binding transcriptional regulator YdaS (Cro superfamily)
MLQTKVDPYRFRREKIAEAIELLGSQENLAYACGCVQQTISYALRNGYCSPRLAIRIERATRRRIKASDVCPDMDLPDNE